LLAPRAASGAAHRLQSHGSLAAAIRTGHRAPPPPRAGDNNVAPAAPADSAAAALAAAPAEEPWRWERTGDAVRAYAVFGAVLALGALPAAQDWRDASLAYFSALAATTIYLGAHRGLNQPQRQEIGLKQGALAPVAASAALFGIYLVVKYFPDLSFQTAADCYFALIGAIAAGGALAAPARTLAAGLGAPAWRVPLPSWLGAVDGAGAPVADAPLAPTDLLVAAAAIALVYADYAAHHGNHSLNNAIACLVAADILQVGARRASGALLRAPAAKPSRS
jgi:minor histocompatibility antigen H13